MFTIISIIIIIIIIIMGIQPLGRSGQRPELSQATGMALVRCILGKFLGVVCHCFPQIISMYHMKLGLMRSPQNALILTLRFSFKVLRYAVFKIYRCSMI